MGTNKPAAGFSVLEMVVAIAVIGVSLLGLAQLLSVAIQQNDFARYSTIGIEVARGKLEELKAAYNRQIETGALQDSLSDGEHGPENIVLPSYSSAYGFRTLAVKWWVDSPSAARKNIRISVWPAGVATDESFNTQRSKAITINTALTP